MDFPAVKEEKLYWGRTIGRPRIVHGHKALVNPDTNQLYSIVSKQYKLIKHEDAVQAAIDAVNENPEYGGFTQKIDFYKEDSRMKFNLQFPEHNVEIGNGDTLHPNIDIINSYDSGWRLQIMFGAYRIVCSNGLMIGERVLNVQKIHKGGISPMFIKEVLSKSMNVFSMQVGIWQKWYDQVIEPTQQEELLKQFNFSEKQVESIKDEVEVSSGEFINDGKPKTMWIYYNILMAYITHRIRSGMRQVDLRNQASKVFR